MDHDEMAELLRENLKLTRETHRMIKGLHRSMVWGRVKSAIKILLLIVFILATWWGVKWALNMWPLLEKQLAPYKSVLELPKQLNQAGGSLKGLDMSKLPDFSKLQIPPELLKLLPQILPQLMPPEKK